MGKRKIKRKKRKKRVTEVEFRRETEKRDRIYAGGREKRKYR